MRDPHDVDVLVVNYLTGDLAVSAVARVSGPGVHALVLDNSGDVPEGAVEALGGELVRSPTNVFYARGNNVLFERCDAPFVLLLNPDVQCSPEALARLRRALEERPEAWAAAPRLRNEDGTDQDYYRRLPSTSSIVADRLPFLRRPLAAAWNRYLCADLDVAADSTVEAPPAACLLVRRDRLDGLLFDEQFPLFFNDTDLARRAAGPALLVAEAEVTHLRGASLAEERRRRPYALSLSYDRSARRYARAAGLRGWPVVTAVTYAREVVTLLLSIVDRARRRA